jgi:hypothetical protein
MTMRRSKWLAFAALTASVALAACGGGSKAATTPSTASHASGGVSAVAWVAGLCGFGETLSGQINDRTQQLQNFTPSSLEEAKQTFVDYLTFVLNEFTALQNQITSLGTPDVPGADAAIQHVKTQFQAAEAELQTVLNQAKNLPTDDANAFTQGIDQITASLDRAQPFGGPNGSLSFGQSDLDAAYRANATCQQLESGSSATPSASQSS